MRVALCAYAAVGICYGNAEANGAPRIRVKGTSRLDAHVARASGKLAVSGTLVDDAGQPLAGAKIALTIVRGPTASPAAGDASDVSHASEPITGVPLAGGTSENCAGSDAHPLVPRGDLLLLPTDEGGRFCVRLTLAMDRYVAHLEALPSGLVDGTRVSLPVDLARAPIALRFDPERSVAIMSLDDEVTTLASVASIEDDGLRTSAPGLLLSLSNENGTELGTATTDASGGAVFRVATAHLGPPGPGELRVSFDGTSEASAATHAVAVERRTDVDLVARDERHPRDELRGGRLSAGSPEDGIALLLSAKPRCVEKWAGTPTGTVEARVGGVVVGAAPVLGGQIRLVMTFAMPRADEVPEVPVSLRYLPDAPWFQATGDLLLVQPVRGASPWRRASLFVAAAAVIAWMALARGRWEGRARRAHSTAAVGQSPPPRQAAQAEARIDLVRAAHSPQGWTGVVVDAHDGLAVAGARVSVQRLGFAHSRIIAETVSDEAGAFALPAVEARWGDELVAEGLVHGALRGPVPASGQLAIALSLRRRAMLERLVGWARRRGNPPGALAEPTPAQVRAAAGTDEAIAQWADAVERAAYGGSVIDRDAENEVEQLAPKERPELIARRR